MFKKWLSTGYGIGLVVVCALFMAAGVNGVFNNVTANGTINSVGGYKFAGGAGIAGQALCSNGTVFNTLCSPGQFYQTVDSAGVAQTQRAALDFGSQFVLSDSASPSKTSVALAGTPYSCSGSYPTETCYEVGPSGKITASGHITVTFPSGTLATGSVSYPVTFTNIPALLLTAVDNADGSNNFDVWGNSGSTSGSSVSVRCAVNIGGSGCSGSLASTVAISWMAVGK